MKRFFLLAYIICLSQVISAHPIEPGCPVSRSTAQEAVQLIDQFPVPAVSEWWPQVNASLFVKNLRANVISPEVIYQGLNTNFCGYAALTYLLVTHNPKAYVQCMLDLFSTGQGSMESTQFKPGKAVRNKAGTLKNKKFLDHSHADQLWFLTLADEFKGYVNILNRHFDKGDENKHWASTNYAKFNRMAMKLGGYSITSKGADLIKPHFDDLPQYVSAQLQKGSVVLFANRRIKDKIPPGLKIWLPTHFLVVSHMSADERHVSFQFWDYGAVKIKVMTREKFRKTIFGVSTFTYAVNTSEGTVVKSN